MKDDVSAIPSDACNVVNSQTVIYSYRNNLRTTYTQIGGKWIETARSSYNTLPVNAVCVDVSQLNSNAVFEPFLYFVSFGLFLVSAYLFFSVVKRLIYGVRVGS